MNDSDHLTSGHENRPGPEPVKTPFFKNRWVRTALGLAIGAFVGIMYWNFIGCSGGSCPLTSTPTNTIVLFTFMGAWMSYK